MTTPVWHAGVCNQQADSGATFSFALDAGTNAGRTVVFVGLSNNGASTIDSATYGGSAMTALPGSSFLSAGLVYNVTGWYLANAPSGSNNIVVTPHFSGAGCNVYYTAHAYDTCDTVTPVSGTVHYSTANGAVSTGAFTSAVGELAVCVGGAYAGGAAVTSFGPGTGVTTDFSGPGGSVNVAGYAYEKAGASSVTITATLSSATPTDNWGFGFSLLGGSAAAQVPYNRWPQLGPMVAQ